MSNASGLVLDIDFTEKSGSVAEDASRYGNDGALNGCKWVEHGLEFNGSSDYVDCGNDESLKLSPPFSISIWVIVNDLATFRRLITSLDTVNKSGYDIFLDDNGQVKFQVGIGTGYKYAHSSFVIDDEEYHNVVCTWASAKLKIYVDGNENYIGQETTGAYTQSTNNILIGKYSGGGHLTGRVDDVRIYNRALNASEIKAYYDSTKHRYK